MNCSIVHIMTCKKGLVHWQINKRHQLE